MAGAFYAALPRGRSAAAAALAAAAAPTALALLPWPGPGSRSRRALQAEETQGQQPPRRRGVRGIAAPAVLLCAGPPEATSASSWSFSGPSVSSCQACCSCWRVRVSPVRALTGGVVPSAPTSASSSGAPPAPERVWREGDAVVNYPNDSIYEGQLVDGKRHGFGTLTRADGTVYDGEWANDELNGEGTERCPDGTCFTGHYVSGMRTGHGVVTWPEGSKYSGQFERGKANGEGYLLRTDGSVYKGQFGEDCMSGEGCMRWKDGAEYTGQFLANRRDGKGKMKWMTGRWKCYEGEWKDGRQHGFGTVTDQRDEEFSGRFQFGKLISWVDKNLSPGDDSVELKVPSYWANQDISTCFSERLEVSDAFQKLMQKLLDRTFRSVRTRDRRKGDLPARLRMLKCHRVENSAMWARYVKAKARVVSRRLEKDERVPRIEELCGAPEDGVVKTRPHLSDEVAEQLDERINEHFLWHGTTPEAATGISKNGFRIAFAGSHAGTYFGRGCYFAECSSKADEYAKEGDDLLAGVYALLLCRVTCGSVFRLAHPDDKAIEAALDSTAYDSVLGDREASVSTYREFVSYDEELAYPEFVVLYERKFEQCEQTEQTP